MNMEGARVHLKGWQQAAVAVGSALGALMDPRRADLIGALGETTGKPAFHRVLEWMKNSREGREVLLERPRVISSRVSHAWDFPENTFGAAYARFMGSRNFFPDDRPPVRFMDTEDLAYVATRAREVHDFWHVLFDLPTNLIGESALKVIEFEQMLLPMCLLSVVGGSARFNDKQRRLFFQHYFPWATRAGLRGAYNMMVKLSKEQLDRGVICLSAGNNAQGVALAAQRLGCDAMIAMPVTTPEIKWRSVEKLGATVLVGDSYDEAESYAKKQANQEGRTFIPPFYHPDVIMGQGTVGMEILRHLKGPPHAIFVPVGGGGLIAGIAAYIKRVFPEVKIIVVEPSDTNAMALFLYHGQRIMLEQVGTFTDGVAVTVVGEEMFQLCRELVDGIILVSRDAICASKGIG